MANLRQQISDITRNKRFIGTIVDVVNNVVSVRLLDGNNTLTGIQFSGERPVIGQSVYIDYTTGTPIVYTSSIKSETTVQDVQRSEPTPTIPNDLGDVPSNDAHFIWGAPISPTPAVEGQSLTWREAEGNWAPGDPQFNGENISMTYLRLDAANGPVTGPLAINIADSKALEVKGGTTYTTAWESGAIIATGSFAVSSETGSPVRNNLSIGTAYSLEAYNGPWYHEPGDNNPMYSWYASNSATPNNSNYYVLESAPWIDTISPAGSYKKIYFTAETQYLSVQIADFEGMFFDNHGTLSWRLCLAYSPGTAVTGTVMQVSGINGTITTVGQVISTIASPNPPLVVTSATNVPNLNADTVDGHHGHAAVTVNTTHTSVLSVLGQELTLLDVLTPAEHTAIGNNSPHHAAASVSSPLEITGQAITLPAATTSTPGYMSAADKTKLDGINGTNLPIGTNTGDFIRFNAVSGQWEVAYEPLQLNGIVLTPSLASLVEAEGAIYYNSSTKSVMVCTDI